MTFDERIDRLTERHEALAESVGLLAESQRKTEDVLRKTEDVLRRAIRLGVREARNERKRRQEADARFDEQIGQLASAHLLTEEAMARLNATVDGFIESLKRGGNGHSS